MQKSKRETLGAVHDRLSKWQITIKTSIQLLWCEHVLSISHKKNQNTSTRYGELFICLVSCALHTEMTKSMETDSFILALRRFIAGSCNAKNIQFNNGSNFVGAERELAKSMEETNHSKIQGFMLNQNADCIVWKRNSPLGSHIGGALERQIRSARSIIFTSLLRTHSSSLDEESLNILFEEVDAIINTRPLFVETINNTISVELHFHLFIWLSKSKW